MKKRSAPRRKIAAAIAFVVLSAMFVPSAFAGEGDDNFTTASSGAASSTERTRRPNGTDYRSWVSPEGDVETGVTVMVKYMGTHEDNYEILFRGAKKSDGVKITDTGSCMVPGPEYEKMDDDRNTAYFTVVSAQPGANVHWFSGFLRLSPGFAGGRASEVPFLLAWAREGMDVKFIVGEKARELVR